MVQLCRGTISTELQNLVAVYIHYVHVRTVCSSQAYRRQTMSTNGDVSGWHVRWNRLFVVALRSQCFRLLQLSTDHKQLTRNIVSFPLSPTNLMCSQ